MGNILSSLSKTIHASLALAIILFLFIYQNDGFSFDTLFWSWVEITHVVVGIMWIVCCGISFCSNSKHG